MNLTFTNTIQSDQVLPRWTSHLFPHLLSKLQRRTSASPGDDSFGRQWKATIKVCLSSAFSSNRKHILSWTFLWIRAAGFLVNSVKKWSPWKSKGVKPCFAKRRNLVWHMTLMRWHTEAEPHLLYLRTHSSAKHVETQQISPMNRTNCIYITYYCT